ncbi:hypothetical protein PHLGIDRAFT_48278, partial [Phlebiopsis gigantea 11061_1 CR5-6]
HAGRGTGRGRGGRGQGRGRGGFRGGSRGSQPRQTEANVVPQESLDDTLPSAVLAMPLGHHPDLRDRLSAFTQSLLSSDPAIPGLDESIVVSPRRLHITLGVMSLTDTSPVSSSVAPPRTVESALALLAQLRPRIMDILNGEELRVALQRADIMRPERGDLEKAHVMWVGPPHEGEDAARLKHLHCTVLNTTYRRPRPLARQPFSYAAALSSTAFRSVEQPHAISDNTTRGRQPIPVNFGEWTVDEIQICKMGSWGPEGEYV